MIDLEKDLAWPVFAYGSLRKGFFNHDKAFAGLDVAIRPARVRGAVYHISAKGYPALAPGEGWVTGELYTLQDPAVLALLDEIENYKPGRAGNEYERRLTAVEDLLTNTEVRAWVYWYAEAVEEKDGFLHIPGGDWKTYMHGSDSAKRS